MGRNRAFDRRRNKRLLFAPRQEQTVSNGQ